jgi:hypothetical protein
MYKPFLQKYKYIIFILLIIFGQSEVFGQSEESAFIKDILSETDYDDLHTPWISINVESPEYNGKAVIENQHLYFYLYHTRNIYDKKYRNEYKKTMYRILKEKSTLKIKKKGDFAKYQFNIVPNDTAVIANAQKGVEHFIETYVREDDFLIIDGKLVGDEKLYAVVSQLYDFNIKVIRDCVSGFLRKW